MDNKIQAGIAAGLVRSLPPGRSDRPRRPLAERGAKGGDGGIVGKRGVDARGEVVTQGVRGDAGIGQTGGTDDGLDGVFEGPHAEGNDALADAAVVTLSGRISGDTLATGQLRCRLTPLLDGASPRTDSVQSMK